MKETERELRNWARAHADHWLENHLCIDEPPAFKQYQSGKAFDEPETAPDPIDEQMAEKTEAIIVKIGLQDLDIYQAMVGFYPYRKSADRIAQEMGKSVPYVHGCIRAGKRMYHKMRKKWK